MALVEVGRYLNSFEAGLDRARLQAEGIPSFIFGMELHTVFAGGVFNIRLLVDDEDLDTARALLAEGA